MKILIWLILCLIWGTTWIFIKIGLQDLPPFTFSLARFIVSLSILFLIIKFQKIILPKTKSEWKLLVLTGILQFALNYSTVFWSEQYISSGLAAVLQGTISVFGLILAWIFLPEEKITWVKFGAVLLGIVGVAVVFYDQLQVNNFMAFAGCAAIVFGSYCAAQSSILIKAKASGMHPAALLFCQMLCGILPIAVYALAKEGNPLNLNWNLRAVLCVLYLSVFGTIAAFWLYYWLLSRIESTKAMMISLVTPLIAVIIGAVFLDETLPKQTAWGGILILLSVALIAFRKQTKPEERT